MQKKKLALNTASSLIYELSAIICGFVLPRLILATYGSDVNGLVNSITQFLSVISFLDLGVGAVVQSSLYKPLVQNDNDQISKIVVSAQRFFRKIALVLLFYVIILILCYPFATIQSFDWLYTALLVAAISISTFSQYYFGVVDRLFLTADQRGYIQYTAQAITLILNTVACSVLIYFGAGIHAVKLVTSLLYLLRPLYLRWYVNKHYSINRKIEFQEEPISQKWNGIAQHVASVVLDNTDTIVLTIFSTLENVSIYSVYNTVVYGIKRLFRSMTSGIQALLGELWAKQDQKGLQDTFAWFEWIFHTGTVLVFGCTGVLIVPFIMVYTKGITDANYYQPLFAALITLANASHCLRLPYNVMILAAGHYKQTQHNYILAAIINIVVSIIFVSKFGLIGVAIGTLAAMVYQTVWMAFYNSKNLLKRSVIIFFKQIFVDFVVVLVGVFSTIWISFNNISYLSWIFLAVEVLLIWIVVVLVINCIFYREKLKRLLGTAQKRFTSKNM